MPARGRGWPPGWVEAMGRAGGQQPCQAAHRLTAGTGLLPPQGIVSVTGAFLWGSPSPAALQFTDTGDFSDACDKIFRAS